MKITALLCTVLVVCLVACDGESETVEEAPPLKTVATLEPATSTTVPPTVTSEPRTDTPVPPTLNAMEVAMTEQALAQEVATPIPTRTPTPTSCEDVEGVCLWVSFDGDECTYDGPAEFRSGKVTILFFNESQVEAGPNLWKHNEGRTFQEMIDYIGVEPSTVFHPPWSTRVTGVRGAINAGRSRTWEGILRPGIYTLVCYRRTPHGLWYGDGITAEE